jgi:hypothetical protein
MEHKIMKKIILLLMFISIVALTSCNKTPLEKAVTYLDKSNSKTITLSDYTNFKWDEVWIVDADIWSKFFPLIMKRKNIDVKELDHSLGGTCGELSSYIIIYVYNKKAVYYEHLPCRGRGIDWYYSLTFNLFDKEFIILLKNQAIFNVKRYGTSSVYYKLEPNIK